MNDFAVILFCIRNFNMFERDMRISMQQIVLMYVEKHEKNGRRTYVAKHINSNV